MFFTWMVTLSPVFMANSFLQHRSLPRSKFVFQFHYLSSNDTELVGEIKWFWSPFSSRVFMFTSHSISYKVCFLCSVWTTCPIIVILKCKRVGHLYYYQMWFDFFSNCVFRGWAGGFFALFWGVPLVGLYFLILYSHFLYRVFFTKRS